MADVTVLGTAAQQLRPLENTNIGTIVEENIRYWKKFDDEQEAARKAAQLRQAEFEYKKAKDKEDALMKITDAFKAPDSAGRFDYEVAKYNNYQAEQLYQDVQKARSGELDTTELSIKAQQRKERMRIVANLNNLSTKIENERLQGKEPNPALDGDTVGFIKSFSSNMYTFDPEKDQVLMVNPVTKEEQTYSISELNNKIMSLDYTPITDFTEQAKLVAANIAQAKIDGNISISRNNRETALDYSLGIMSDTNKAIEYAYDTNYLNSANDANALKALKSLSGNELAEFKNKMAQDFANSRVVPALDVVSNRLNNIEQNQRITRTQRDLNESKPTYFIKTDEANNVIRETKFQGTNRKLNEGVVIVGGAIRPGTKIPSTNSANANPLELNDIVITENNEVFVTAKQKRTVQGNQVYRDGKPVFEDVTEFVTKNGDIVTDPKTGEAKTKLVRRPVYEKREVLEDVLIDDQRIISDILPNLLDPRSNTGQTFGSDRNARGFLFDLKAQQAPARNTRTNQTPTNQNTNETPEQRRARLIAEAEGN